MNRSAATALAILPLAVVVACHGPENAKVRVSGDDLWVDAAKLDSGEARVVEAREQALPQFIAAAGRVAFDDQRVQHVLSPVAGRVSRVLAQPGQPVHKGTPLLALASPDVGTAFSDLLKAQADVRQTDAELTRQRRLVSAQAAPQRDLEAAEDAHRKALAELARAKQKAALLRSGDIDEVTQELTLKSAIGGTVIARAVSPGLEVQGAYSGGNPVELFTIGNIDHVWVLAEIAERNLAGVRVGLPATVHVAAWPGRQFQGEVQWISATLDPVVRTAQARIVLPNSDHALRPEMFAQVAISTAPHRALALTGKAVVELEGQSFVYVTDGEPQDGKFHFKRRRVHVAPESIGDLVLVESGLAEGERVLIEGAPLRGVTSGEVRVSESQFEKAGMRVATIGERDVEDALAASARVAFDDVKAAHVFSPVTGRVARVVAQPGQRVTKGAPLLSLISPDVGSAYSDAVRAEADRIAAEHEVARQRELFEAHAGSHKDLEVAEATFRKAAAELERARQKTRLLSAGMFDAVTQEYTLRSPIDGEVIARTATPGLEVQGQWSGASTPVELFTIGALDPLWVIGDVYDLDLPHVKTGQRVEVRVSTFPDRVFKGRVDWVADVIDPTTRTAKIRCAIANPERLLRPEMAPVLTIALPSHRHVAVPRQAVLRLGNETVVFVAAGKTQDGALAFRRRTVIVGEDRPGGLVPILEGVVAGEQVVVSGAIFLVGLL